MVVLLEFQALYLNSTVLGGSVLGHICLRASLGSWKAGNWPESPDRVC